MEIKLSNLEEFEMEMLKTETEDEMEALKQTEKILKKNIEKLKKLKSELEWIELKEIIKIIVIAVP